MTHHSPRRPRTAVWVTVTILLVVAVAGTLAVPIYARRAPVLLDFPFFYWYQLLWVPVVGILCGISYFLVTSGDAAARRREAAASGSGADDTGVGNTGLGNTGLGNTGGAL
jgi:Protein of unknown function (DUF3311)